MYIGPFIYAPGLSYQLPTFSPSNGFAGGNDGSEGGGGGGGGGAGPAPQRPPSPPRDCEGGESDAAYVAGAIADATETGAEGAAFLGVITSETGVGLIGFEGAAAVLKGVSLAATAVKGILDYRSGNHAAAVGAAVGVVAGFGVSGAFGAAMRSGQKSVGAVDKLAPEVLGALSDKGAAEVSCSLSGGTLK